MCDQLRWDYLSCYGHPRLATPHIDGLATKGVRFTRAYVQSPVCGASRMSFYTGRYVQSHGATWNGVPLKVGEMTLGDYLRPLGVDAALVGTTHMRDARAAPNGVSPPARGATGCMGPPPMGATSRKAPATTAISTTRATPGTTPGT